MLFLRAPYGEEKLFALISPAHSSWGGQAGVDGIDESSAAESRLAKKAPAARARLPQDAQALAHDKAVVPEKSNHNNANNCSTAPQRLDIHTTPGAREQQGT
ncbi:hypothetical protein Q7P37_002699 [Cladosporium fusiforme]